MYPQIQLFFIYPCLQIDNTHCTVMNNVSNNGYAKIPNLYAPISLFTEILSKIISFSYQSFEMFSYLLFQLNELISTMTQLQSNKKYQRCNYSSMWEQKHKNIKVWFVFYHGKDNTFRNSGISQHAFVENELQT